MILQFPLLLDGVHSSSFSIHDEEHICKNIHLCSDRSGLQPTRNNLVSDDPLAFSAHSAQLQSFVSQNILPSNQSVQMDLGQLALPFIVREAAVRPAPRPTMALIKDDKSALRFPF